MSEERGWAAYNEAQVGREPRQLCQAVITRAGPGRRRLAVDLGCGAGVEARALLAAGWRVLAVDSDPSTTLRLDRENTDRAELQVLTTSLERVDLPTADLIHASYALPFVAPTDFDAVWRRIRGSLAPGGWLAVDLFGDRDEWAGEKGMTFVTRQRVDQLLDGLDVLDLSEEDQNGQSFAGPKHWHVFHVLARKHPSAGHSRTAE